MILSRLSIRGILTYLFSLLKLSLEKRGIAVCIPGTGKRSPGFTIIELLIVVGIIGILGTLGTTAYVGQIKKARINVAIADINAISLDIDAYSEDSGEPPETLEEVRHERRTDPWGNPYRYFKIVGAKGLGGMRKDRFIVPLNSDYDLYSVGPDGQSKPPLTAKASWDDIIRANDGEYVGPAYAY